MTPTPEKKPSARKSLHLFTNILDLKNKTAICPVGSEKSKRKEIKVGTTLWKMKTKRKGNSKINNWINNSLYNWIILHSHIVQSPIFNNIMKMNIDDHTRPKIVPSLLLQVYVRELHKILVNYPYDVGLKEARDAENSITISNST